MLIFYTYIHTYIQILIFYTYIQVLNTNSSQFYYTTKALILEVELIRLFV